MRATIAKESSEVKARSFCHPPARALPDARAGGRLSILSKEVTRSVDACAQHDAGDHIVGDGAALRSGGIFSVVITFKAAFRNLIDAGLKVGEFVIPRRICEDD